jgi:hypothetical protein
MALVLLSRYRCTVVSNCEPHVRVYREAAAVGPAPHAPRRRLRRPRRGDENELPDFTIEALGDEPQPLQQHSEIEFRTGQDGYAMTPTPEGLRVDIRSHT